MRYRCTHDERPVEASGIALTGHPHRRRPPRSHPHRVGAGRLSSCQHGVRPLSADPVVAARAGAVEPPVDRLPGHPGGIGDLADADAVAVTGWNTGRRPGPSRRTWLFLILASPG